MPITQDRLKELLECSPETGLFYWKVDRSSRVRAGNRAGSQSSSTGYRVINMSRKIYAEHRLAWLHMTGEWPEYEVDHRDLNRANNAWSNLRAATSSQNKANRPARGVYPKGVSFHRASGLFSSRAHKNGRQISLGYFKTPELAHAAYREGAQQIHGEFARSV